MSRFTEIITLDKFKSICLEKLGIGTDEFDVFEMGETIDKDLSKINFSMENWVMGNADPSYEDYPRDNSGYCNYPCGYEVLPNGMPVLFFNAGGDWECPICFCIYWDGKKLRAYIPDEGNLYHRKEKCAFGSEDEPEELQYDEYGEEVVEPQGDPDKIRQDVTRRIQIKGNVYIPPAETKKSIDKVMEDKKSLNERISAGLDRELGRQKKSGKKFISDEEIDELIDLIIKEELGK